MKRNSGLGRRIIPTTSETILGPGSCGDRHGSRSTHEATARLYLIRRCRRLLWLKHDGGHSSSCNGDCASLLQLTTISPSVLDAAEGDLITAATFPQQEGGRMGFAFLSGMGMGNGSGMVF
ncbi:hypothetical protein PIB30_041838 [Stylosanthes scabra]|uniref:Uncharacterized protein n=1 Tax=Stylosanthes scabra TaxID=79078 RepID=A0ABU6RFN1_9FABA|nr:hypothetical protein [Stylosanthes scabra]